MLGGLAVPSLQLDLVKTIYDYAYLDGRQRAGVPLAAAERAQLAALRTALAPAQPERRAHRRQVAALPVLLKGAAGTRAAFAHNLSGGGMLVECAEPLAVGEPLRARLGSTGETEYIFACRVVHRAGTRYGLRFEGIPLEIRYGSYSRTVERASPPRPAAARDE